MPSGSADRAPARSSLSCKRRRSVCRATGAVQAREYCVQMPTFGMSEPRLLQPASQQAGVEQVHHKQKPEAEHGDPESGRSTESQPAATATTTSAATRRNAGASTRMRSVRS
jgi:hypothetical protein